MYFSAALYMMTTLNGPGTPELPIVVSAMNGGKLLRSFVRVFRGFLRPLRLSRAVRIQFRSLPVKNNRLGYIRFVGIGPAEGLSLIFVDTMSARVGAIDPRRHQANAIEELSQ